MMKRASPPPVSASTLQRHIAVDDFDQIVFIFQLCQKFCIQSFPHLSLLSLIPSSRALNSLYISSISFSVNAQLCGTKIELNTATANLSVMEER